jgi:hypothetical protein
MAKTLVLAGLLGALAAPAVAQAGGSVTSGDRQNAAQECRFERGATAATREAFAARYATNKNRSNAFGKCVSAKARGEVKERERVSRAATAAEKAADDKDREEAADRKTAAKQCERERGSTSASRDAFAKKYGTNVNKRNAFGKCVSKLAKALANDGAPHA